MSDSLQPHGLYSPWNSPGQNTGVGSLSLLQGIFPTQESNQGLLHCRRILYQLSYQGILGKRKKWHIIWCHENAKGIQRKRETVMWNNSAGLAEGKTLEQAVRSFCLEEYEPQQEDMWVRGQWRDHLDHRGQSRGRSTGERGDTAGHRVGDNWPRPVSLKQQWMKKLVSLRPRKVSLFLENILNWH